LEFIAPVGSIRMEFVMMQGHTIVKYIYISSCYFSSRFQATQTAIENYVWNWCTLSGYGFPGQ
jgi:hypothetical protein